MLRRAREAALSIDGPQELYTNPWLWWAHPSQYSRQLHKKRDIEQTVLEFFWHLAGKGVVGASEVIININCTHAASKGLSCPTTTSVGTSILTAVTMCKLLYMETTVRDGVCYPRKVCYGGSSISWKIERSGTLSCSWRVKNSVSSLRMVGTTLVQQTGGQ
ncbi:hypothetical protein HETIRDRAFT_314872 [Heterobasidion irregulare TC 32-1]|uniref:Uncharacterized protein n=1 Tax=Heterobasidion irregulare (strain TC 32-1) TaxID=747525 RepID=W4K986_HETIT|nr:uncharacterized protein HETIRDRAFT_314872 [Heterobasidion irregulare TC 32-1]XP_009553011.1 uncharacterized protein HETIRDRAFT_423262 [Heterobasidion irregulare TC 32-1]ETW75615.1 hypothetical protein HETIRDRAFT_423262 [Heterobasidion irregulare TC 32-1]ETW82397.1 hypothetical protein HETIRDRAFT_314872 [Heterobasidion irregulare TC 32-1]